MINKSLLLTLSSLIYFCNPDRLHLFPFIILQLDDTAIEERTDTDKNMATMFDILRKNKKAGLENLVLNKNSFAQTVENIFALSFLVKDGRADIAVNEEGLHILCKI